MTARYLVGDVLERLAELPDGSVDLVLTSPPFLALRSYLPDDHPDKAKELGSEATPAEYLDNLLTVTAAWRRVLAPHGSIAVELGDTYAGSGGAGGDYNPGGLREAQQRFDGSSGAKRSTRNLRTRPNQHNSTSDAGGGGWPLDKSLCMIPGLYGACLAYGVNVLTGQTSRAGRWRVRTVKAWIRTNPPVGALGDKERPATSYVVVATMARNRWFDLDSVRVPPLDKRPRRTNGPKLQEADGSKVQTANYVTRVPANDAGGPPTDWWHETDAILDAALREFTHGTSHPRTAQGIDRRTTTGKPAADGRGGGWASLDTIHAGSSSGIRGWHMRRALERAGILQTLEALDVTARGYGGAHYAVWPPELVRLLLDEMCPRRVCRTCGHPSRRLVEASRPGARDDRQRAKHANGQRPHPGRQDRAPELGWQIHRVTTGWTTCGCPGTGGLRIDGFHEGPGWRAGLVLDTFAGSGTTGAAATGLGRDCILIDLDDRNVDLARERIGLFLDVEPQDAADAEGGPT